MLHFKTKYPPIKAYWYCQLIGWSVYTIINVFVIATLNQFSVLVFMVYTLVALLGFILTHFYRNYLVNSNQLNLGLKKVIIHNLLGALLIAVIWTGLILLLSYPLKLYFSDPEAESITIVERLAYYTALFVNLGLLIVFWIVIYYTFHIFRTRQLAQVEKWKMEATVKEAELIALKAQINPHFLFNSLNNIRSLITENPEHARDMITQLSDLLRYSIQYTQKERVSLERELEIVRSYLKLESIQFEDRLHYEFDIDPHANSLKIPPMVIQLLVENAIKHGLAHLPEGGEIRIRAQVKQEKLEIEVWNTGQLEAQFSESGLGLRNANQRLRLLSDQMSKVELSQANENMVIARFSINIIDTHAEINYH